MGDAVKAMCAAAVEMLDTDDTELDDWIVKTGLSLLGDDEDPAPPEDVPRDVARAVAFHSYTDGLTDGRRAARSLAFVAAAVRGPPEQFYFERHLLDAFHTPCEPSRTELLLAPHRKVERATHQPAQRAKVPGPNEPCFCGSGRSTRSAAGREGAYRPGQGTSSIVLATHQVPQSLGRRGRAFDQLGDAVEGLVLDH